MDGNGRWASKKGKRRVFGHSQATGAVGDTIMYCVEHNIQYLTLFAFSTENWKRPKEETDFLFDLIIKFVDDKLKEIMKHNVRINWIGRRSKVPTHIKENIEKAEKASANNTGLTLNIALDYGSRHELVAVSKQIASDVKEGKLSIEDITDDTIKQKLYTGDQPDPDLIIRTSGELRISNFMLWQGAYSELIFLKENWPDFNKELMGKAIEEYSQRVRRLGGLESNSPGN